LHGGGVYYSAIPITQRGLDLEVYTVLSPSLINHPVVKYAVKSQYSTRTNIFILEYTGSSRVLRVLEVAPPIYQWNTHSELCYTIVNPVMGEVDISLLKLLRAKSLLIAVDIQGFIRAVNSNGLVFLKSSSEAISVLELADIVHADTEEATCLARCIGDNLPVERALSKLSKYSRGVLLVTSGSNKITVVHRGEVRIVEVEDKYRAVEKTGAGDYFLTEYFINYITSNDIVESVHRAHKEVTKWLIIRDKVLHHAPTTQ